MRMRFGCAVLLLGTTVSGCSSSSSDPQATGYDLRRDAYFQVTIEAESQNAYSEVMRLELGIEPASASGFRTSITTKTFPACSRWSSSPRMTSSVSSPRWS